ncbi:MAG: hypothetical protein SGJ27_25255 [Candidatus Melainabacteria bacterium]|nr:hypothetical protein [Candidatus Melainabacteria bacterium]
MAIAERTMKKRKLSGIAAIEIACGLVLIMVISLLAVDITILLLGYDFNDRACRDACKAASKQSSSVAAQTAASSTLKSHKADGNFVTDPILLTGAGDFNYQSFGLTGGSSSVTVTTECKVKTPVPLTFVGNVFGERTNGKDATWTFRKRYTLPIATYNAQLP